MELWRFGAVRSVDVGRGFLPRRRLVSPFRCSTKQIVVAKFLVHQCLFLFDSGVWNACIILFMYLFILFLIDKKIAVK